MSKRKNVKPTNVQRLSAESMNNEIFDAATKSNEVLSYLAPVKESKDAVYKQVVKRELNEAQLAALRAEGYTAKDGELFVSESMQTAIHVEQVVTDEMRNNAVDLQAEFVRLSPADFAHGFLKQLIGGDYTRQENGATSLAGIVSVRMDGEEALKSNDVRSPLVYGAIANGSDLKADLKKLKQGVKPSYRKQGAYFVSPAIMEAMEDADLLQDHVTLTGVLVQSFNGSPVVLVEELEGQICEALFGSLSAALQPVKQLGDYCDHHVIDKTTVKGAESLTLISTYGYLMLDNRALCGLRAA